MTFQVDFQITRVVERLLALGAGEGLLPNVTYHVLLKLILFELRLRALGAAVQFLTRVLCEMFAQVHRC
jgi:hypothetical protein